MRPTMRYAHFAPDVARDACNLLARALAACGHQPDGPLARSGYESSPPLSSDEGAGPTSSPPLLGSGGASGAAGILPMTAPSSS